MCPLKFECEVPTDQARLLGHALAALARVGEEALFEAVLESGLVSTLVSISFDFFHSTAIVVDGEDVN